MSKRAISRPPRLDAPKPRQIRREPRRPTARARVLKTRIAGRHDRLGRTELLSVMRRIIGGDPVALLGLDRFAGVDLTELQAVASETWGWDTDELVVTIDPDRLLAAMLVARERVLDVARRGGRILIATSRPASLLSLHQEFARLARATGAHVLDEGEAGPLSTVGRRSLSLWWLGGVATLTDGDALVADPGVDALEELLFTVPHPDLVVADRGYAGGALRAGIEVVALADLDALALGVAARQGLPVTVVPVHERRPAAAYSALQGLLAIPSPPEAP